VHDAKGNTKVRLGKTGSDGMPGKLAPSSSYFFDTPERKEITRISGNPFRFTGGPKGTCRVSSLLDEHAHIL
jgi:hypothetical protein